MTQPKDYAKYSLVLILNGSDISVQTKLKLTIDDMTKRVAPRKTERRSTATFLSQIRFLILFAFTLLSVQLVGAFQHPLSYEESVQGEIKFRTYRSKYDTIIQVVGPLVCKNGICPTYLCTHNQNSPCLNSELFMAGTFVFSDDVLSEDNSISVIFCKGPNGEGCSRKNITVDGLELSKGKKSNAIE